MKLKWSVMLTESGSTTHAGYGDTSQAALAELFAKIESEAVSAVERAAAVTAHAARVRGELEALTSPPEGTDGDGEL